MKRRKVWKQLTALTLSAALLVPGPTVFAAENGQTEENPQTGEVDENGFVIENGVLKKYTGEAVDVTIPESVTKIEYSAFDNCNNLKSVTIPEGVTDIGERAFAYCDSLSKISIPGSVTNIEEGVFLCSNSLSEINVSEQNGIYTGENGYLYHKEKAELIAWPAAKGDINIPENVSSISSFAFCGCSSLNSVNIPGTVTTIKSYAFQVCSSLSNVTMSEGVVRIGEQAFRECSSLNKISIPESVISIGDGTFDGCTNLNSIDIPGSLENIGDWAFRSCGSLSEINVSEKNNYYTSENGCLYSKEKTEITAWPTAEGEVNIPKSVTRIGNGAFAACNNLNTVNIPESVTRIESNAFSECSSLSSINMSKGVTNIGDYAFAFCSSLSNIEIPTGVTNMGHYVFSCCDNLSSITIPESVKSIGSGIFEGCPKLTIYGKEGSYAQTYAQIYHIPFVIEGEPTPNPTPTPDPEPGPTPTPDPEPGPTPTPDPEPQPEPTPDPAPVQPQPTQKKSVASCSVILGQTTYTYDGKAKTPAITVKDGAKTLTAGTDYAVTYQNNINVGTAKAVITGQGNYTGTAERTFTIQEAKKNAQVISCKRSYNKTYGDKPFKLNAKITKGNGKLTYKTSNKKVAAVDNKGKVTLKGTGVAEITITAGKTSTYNAKSVKITIKVKPAKQTVKSLKVQHGRKLKVTWKRDKNAAGYEIQYSTDKKFKNKKVTKLTRVNGNKITAKTFTKLTKGKKYYVRVRAFQNAKVNGKSQRLYGDWSNPKRSGTVKK